MALAPAGVSRIPLLQARTLEFNGISWVASGCSLAPPQVDASPLVVLKSVAPRKLIACCAVQESSTPTAPAETKEEKPEAKDAPSETKEAKSGAKPEAKAAPAKPKPAAKAPAKSLPEMMEKEIIPALRSILEAQDDITDLELSFKDNRLEGSFMQNGKPYSFWAFFPDGTLTGPKGFSLSSYGSEVSTIEPFLVDEKKASPKLVVFWIEKRLAAQGILPVWKE